MSKLQESSLYQLTVVRFRLILREPEAIFWIFIFPILLESLGNWGDSASRYSKAAQCCVQV